MDSSRYLRRFTILCICGVAACGLLIPSLALAEEPIQVQDSTGDFVFGRTIRFSLTVSSAAPIQSIVLAYQTSDTRGTTIETMTFNSSTSVSVDHVHEIERRYIRPFVKVTYWWTIVNAEEAKLITEPQTFAYVDNRFDWQTLTEGVVNVHWYRGDLEVAQQAVDVAVAGLNRARQDIHVDGLEKPVDVYLYANAEELGLALPAGLPAGAEALTLYETNVVLVPLGPELGNIPHLRRILPHELTHALIHEATQSDFDHVPLWLSEGLATSVEHTFVPDPNAHSLLEAALRERGPVSLSALCAAFPHDPASARLAYAQSASVIDYIRDMYGRQALRDLIAAYADGATCEGGVRRVLGSSLDRTQTLWLAWVMSPNKWEAFWRDGAAWVILLALFACLPFLLMRSPRASSPALGDQVH